jgi:ferritin-like metal-binding protein YciE
MTTSTDDLCQMRVGELAEDFTAALADAERANKRMTVSLGRLAAKAQKQALNAAVIVDMQQAADETREALSPVVNAIQEATHGS